MRVQKKLLTVAIIWGHNQADHSPFMRTWMRTKPCQCLDCGHKLDASGVVERGDPPPSAGDVIVCLYCGHVMAFKEDLTVRPLTDAEIIEVAGMPELLEVQRFIMDYRRWKDEQKAKSGTLRPTEG